MTLDDNSTSILEELTLEDPFGFKTPLLMASDGRSPTHDLRTEKKKFVINPGVRCRIRLKYVNRHPVNPQEQFVHNSLTVLDPTLHATVSATIPEGYHFMLMAPLPQKPDIWKDRWEYKISGPILPCHMIEYMFTKKK